MPDGSGAGAAGTVRRRRPGRGRRAWPDRAPGRRSRPARRSARRASDATATPTDTLTLRTPRRRRSRSRTAVRMRSPTSTATTGSGLRSRTTNSSPPNRAGTSSSRTAADDGRRDRAQDARRRRHGRGVSLSSLELVDVDHQHADRVAGSTALRQQADVLVEVAPVRQAGQRVGRGTELRLAMRVGAGERRRRLDGRIVEDAPRRHGPRSAPARRDDGADDATFHEQRRDERLGQAVDVADPPADALGDPVGLRTVPPGPGSSRSTMGSRVTDSGTPVRVVTRRASRTRASGRRRTTTTWSAPDARPTSSTMASRIASGETERDRPDRIRANEAASSRRSASSRLTARTWTAAVASAAMPRSRMIRSSRPPAASRSRRAAMTTRPRRVAARIHHDRLMRSSAGSAGRPMESWGSVTSESQCGPPDACGPPVRWYWVCGDGPRRRTWRPGRALLAARLRLRSFGCARSGARSRLRLDGHPRRFSVRTWRSGDLAVGRAVEGDQAVGAAQALDLIEGVVGRGDEVGRRAPVLR